MRQFPAVFLGLFIWLICPFNTGLAAPLDHGEQRQQLTKVNFATDWKAQAEQGGFYQAKALGLYEKNGLDVTIRRGGPGVNIPQLLAAGAIEFGMGSNSFVPLNIVQAGVPARAVMAGFQKDPQILMTHPRDDITSLANMRGKPVMIADATITAFWVWLKAEFGFEDSQIRKYTFNLAPFLVNPKAIQQGYLSSEPYLVERQTGIKPKVFLLSDFGYPSYASMVLTRQDWIDNHPDQVQAFVDASIAGWISYVYGDPTPGNQLILQDNPDMTQDVIDQAIVKMRDNGMVWSGDSMRLGVGAMTEQRWQIFFNTMSTYGIYADDLPWRQAFTTQFINRGPQDGLPVQSAPR